MAFQLHAALSLVLFASGSNALDHDIAALPLAGLAMRGLQEASIAAETAVAVASKNQAGSAAGEDDDSVPNRPQIPECFEAPLKMSTQGLTYPGGKGHFVYDLSRSGILVGLAQTVDVVSKLQPPFYANATSLAVGNVNFQIAGGQEQICRQWDFFTRSFQDLFTWASLPATSKFMGFKSIAGQECAQWSMVHSPPDSNLTLCTTGDDPIELVWRAPFTQAHNLTYIYRFGPMLAVGSKVNTKQLDVPDACRALPPPCPAGRGKEPMHLETYVFHPGMSAQDYEIADQDVADLEGEAMFICADKLGWQPSVFDHDYTRVSLYHLQVSPAFGQYALCNGYPDTSPAGPACKGGDLRLIGKEAPYFAGVGERRCAAESPLGFWYSLPRAGRCPAGQSPGPDAWASGCTWSVVRRIKTVDIACVLNNQRFLDSCQADFNAGLGFHQTRTSLFKVFDTDDISEGGCPDIGGPKWSKAVDFGEPLSQAVVV